MPANGRWDLIRRLKFKDEVDNREYTHSHTRIHHVQKKNHKLLKMDIISYSRQVISN